MLDEAQIARFKEIGITERLLREFTQKFGENGLEPLYRACSHIHEYNLDMYYFTRLEYLINPWVLLYLTGDIALLETNRSELRKYFFRETELEARLELGPRAIHYLALSGSVAALEFGLKEYPEMKGVLDDYGRNILHYAAWSGSEAALQYALEQAPELKTGKDNSGFDFLQYATPEGARTAFARETELLRIKDRFSSGIDPLQEASLVGSVTKMKHILAQDWGASLKGRKSYYLRQNFLHYAAISGSVPALHYALTQAPELKTKKDKDGRNILHFAAWSGSEVAFRYLLEEHPVLASSLWVADKNGDTPDSFTSLAKTKKSATQILNELIYNKLKHILSPQPEDDIAKAQLFIRAFKAKVIDFLFSEDFADLGFLKRILEARIHETLLDNPNFAYELEIREFFSELADKPIRKPELEKISTIIVKKEEEEDLRKATSITSFSRIFFHEKERKTSVLNEIMQWFVRCCGEKLDKEEIITLKVILDDYRRSESPNNFLTRVANVLEGTQQILALRPKPTVATGRDIKPDNYVEHMNVIKKDLLPGNEATYVVEGIGHIIENKQAIASCVKEKAYEGYLYMIPPTDKLPLHLEDYAQLEPEATEKALDRLISNFIGAFYLAAEAGKQQEFFFRFTKGYCLDGRTRDVFTWAASLAGLKNFSDLMQEYIEEYQSYQKTLRGLDKEIIATVKEATDFIVSRHKYFACNPDEHYAPDGEIARKGVEKYIREVLCYEEKIICPSEAERSQYILYCAQNAAQEYSAYHQEHSRVFHGEKGVIRAQAIMQCRKIKDLIPLLEESMQQGGNLPHSLNTFIKKHISAVLPVDTMDSIVSMAKETLSRPNVLRS